MKNIIILLSVIGIVISVYGLYLVYKNYRINR